MEQRPKWEALEKQSAQAGKSLARGQVQILYQTCGATLAGNNLKNSILAKRRLIVLCVSAKPHPLRLFLKYFQKKKPPTLFSRYLHLAIIHEAEDYAIQILKQCQNDPFLNRQNNQRQVIELPHTTTHYYTQRTSNLTNIQPPSADCTASRRHHRTATHGGQAAKGRL